MDYCHPCRRHLNGALACAGCGTPAEALGPFAVPTPDVRDASGGAAPPDGTAAPAGEGSPRRDARRDARRAARRDARLDARRYAGGRPDGRPDGRPASRRRARGGHRRRGRAVLLGALGLLLAAGALSLAELAREPGRDDTAADYVRESPSGPSGAAPEESSADEPRDPGPAGSRPGAATGSATDASPAGTRRGNPSRPPSPDASRTDGPTASPDPGDADAASPDPGDAGPDGADPSDAPDRPPADPPEPDDPREPTTAPAPPSPPAEPTPAPTPSPTCTRFLWWCT
ncbi:hypothetical protein [Streptomyces sp. NPDC017520]|uniref:SCO2400 family protein n=1 Tax=Streptomyces sp. NPDC017520 TaxID=3364998 RepID=UPI00378BD347